MSEELVTFAVNYTVCVFLSVVAAIAVRWFLLRWVITEIEADEEDEQNEDS